MNQKTVLPLPYALHALPHGTAQHYIPATDQDLYAMFDTGLWASYMAVMKEVFTDQENQALIIVGMFIWINPSYLLINSSRLDSGLMTTEAQDSVTRIVNLLS
jgi:hypothetical protein